MNIYEKWGVRPIINVSGSVTRLGGAPMPPAVLDAYCEAAADCVALDELQAAASLAIARVTRAEAGLVTAGSAAALTLGAAAMITGYDVRRMEQLPHCDTFPHELVMAREQRNGYDHAVRAAGVRLVEVGFHELLAGAGVRRAEAWEYEAAIGPRTAGFFYVYDPNSRPPLEEVVKVAHTHGLPVLVDAAGELPPRSNLRDILATGADLVAFSGGKAIRGPQATGILCGRRYLIGPAALQMLDLDDHFELWDPPANLIDKNQLRGFPRHGLGRALKVSKEQIIALLTALQLFIDGAYDAELPDMRKSLDQIVSELRGLPVHCTIDVPEDGQSLPRLEITIDESKLGRTALEVCRSLRRGKPGVHVGQNLLFEGKLIINPLHLNESRTAIVARRLREELS